MNSHHTISHHGTIVHVIHTWIHHAPIWLLINVNSHFTRDIVWFGLILLTILSFISVICYNESCISNMRNKFWTKFCLVVLFTVTSMYKEKNTKVFWPSFDPIITSYLERTVLQVGISTSIFHVNSRGFCGCGGKTSLVICNGIELLIGGTSY